MKEKAALVEKEKEEKMALLQVEDESRSRQVANEKFTELIGMVRKLQGEKEALKNEIQAKEQGRVEIEVRLNDSRIESESLVRTLQMEKNAKEELQKIINRNADLIGKRSVDIS